MPAQATITASLTALLEAAAGGIGIPNHPVIFAPNFVFTDGNGANQISRVWTANRTIAASGNDDIDLNGVLVDGIGQTLSLLRVRALVIRAAAANTNNLVVGPAPANGFVTPWGAATHSNTVRPGGLLLLVAPDATGFAVTAATADLLRITNGAAGSTVNYDIAILGCIS